MGIVGRNRFGGGGRRFSLDVATDVRTTCDLGRGRSVKELKTQIVRLRVTETERELFVRIADAHRTDISGLLRMLVTKEAARMATKRR